MRLADIKWAPRDTNPADKFVVTSLPMPDGRWLIIEHLRDEPEHGYMVYIDRRKWNGDLSSRATTIAQWEDAVVLQCLLYHYLTPEGNHHVA